MRWPAAVMAGVILIVVGRVAAQDWPQWRGAERDGKASGFVEPRAWPAKLAKRWTVNVGKGDSSPSLVGDSLYTFGRVEVNEVVRRLDAGSGTIRWEAAYPSTYAPVGPSSQHVGPRATPTVADGRVYTIGLGGTLSCFDAAKGTLLWRKQSEEDYHGIAHRTDVAVSPLVTDGLCIVQVGRSNSAAIAFDARTGEFRWKWDADGPANSSPVIATVGGRKQLVTMTAQHVVGLALADGKLLWKTPFESVQGNNTTPVVHGATVIYTGEGKGMSALRIEARGDGFEVSPLWSNRRLAARFTTPVLKDGLLYGNTGRFFCASADTGETLWVAGRGGGSASIVDAGPVLVALTLGGELTVFRPGAKQYTELMHAKVSDTEVWAHPVIAGKRLYVRDVETVSLWSIDPDDSAPRRPMGDPKE